MTLNSSLVANEWQNNKVLHQSIEIGAGIWIEYVGQPNNLSALTEDKKRNLKKVGAFFILPL